MPGFFFKLLNFFFKVSAFEIRKSGGVVPYSKCYASGYLLPSRYHNLQLGFLAIADLNYICFCFTRISIVFGMWNEDGEGELLRELRILLTAFHMLASSSNKKLQYEIQLSCFFLYR